MEYHSVFPLVFLPTSFQKSFSCLIKTTTQMVELNLCINSGISSTFKVVVLIVKFHDSWLLPSCLARLYALLSTLPTNIDEKRQHEEDVVTTTSGFYNLAVAFFQNIVKFKSFSDACKY